jgi:hypothetical protein
MSSPSELLNCLRKIGVSATTRKGKLQLRPGSRVPVDLIPEIRRHRDEIISLVSDSAVLRRWTPTTDEEAERERHRVLTEKPKHWWWRPRYRLAGLERAGINRATAIAEVRKIEANEIVAKPGVWDDAESSSGRDAE